MQTRPTALWAIPVSDLAGVARHVVDVVRVGIPGWDVVVLCPQGPLATAVVAAGGVVHEAPFGPEHGLRASVASLRAAVRRFGPRIVHSHLSYADIVVALATPRSARLVTTEHGIAMDDAVYHRSSAQSRVMAAVHAARLRRFDAVIAVSEATRRAMVTKWRLNRTTVVIPNGVDPVTHPARSPGLRVLSLARLAPEKRLPDLLEAFAVVARDHADAHLTLAGEGPLRPALEKQAAALGITDRLDFPGYVDATTALAGADVVVQLSLWENCSYTLLDAITHGLGVVASPIGGNPELLPTSCLVEPLDHTEAARAITGQGLEPALRPSLPPDWPTTAAMTAAVADVYEGCLT